MKTFSLLLIFASWVSGCGYAHGAEAAELAIKDQTVHAEVAQDEVSRTKGLMYRKKLEENSGMLFVMDQSDLVCMWMKNTLIPLSVAFIDQEGKIINIEQMQPQTQDLHCSKAAARFALEMPLGWFKARQIGPGDRVDHLPTHIK